MSWLSILLALASAAAATKSHPFTADDLVTMDRISSVEASPDGKRVVYAVRSTDLDGNRGRTDLWMVGIDGKDARQLTTDPENDTDPAWAPDGQSVFFLSPRATSKTTQVWRVPVDGGEAVQV